MFTNKVVDSGEDLRKIRENNPNNKIVLVSGCFDVVHVGHIKFLQKAKQKGDLLVVGILSDEFVKVRKGDRRPIFSERERKEMLSNFRVVDYVFSFNQKEVNNLLKLLQPDIYCLGGDRKGKKIPELKYLLKYKIEVVELPRFGKKSTSSIIDNLLENI